MSIKTKLLETLQELKHLEYTTRDLARASDAKVDRVLNLLFQVCKKGTQFTDSEKRQIGNLLVDAIRPIQINIESTSIRYRTRLESSVLVKRSALEFLVEDCGWFPAKNSTLFDELEKGNIKQSIEILDEIISRCKNWSDSDEGDSDQETDGLPPKHTWWSN